MALNLFLVLGAYYMLKTIREVLILTQGGAAVKTYSAGGQALLLLVLVPAFGALASRVDRVRLVRWVMLFFVSNLVVLFALGQAGVRLGIPYFLWVGVFNVMVIAQCWAFANDIFAPEQGKRVFAIVGLGGSLGAWVGSLAAKQLIAPLGPYYLMLVAGAVLLSSLGITHNLSARQIRTQGPKQAAAVKEPIVGDGGFTLIRKDRYLTLIAALIVILNVVNTSGEFILSSYVVGDSVQKFGNTPESVEAREAFVGQFYGRYYSYFNVAGLLLQMFAVSRIFKWVGVGGALFIAPLVDFFGFISMTMMPSLGLIGVVKIADNSLDYSVGNTAKQALWLPTSRAAKYKAKQAVDAFFMRAGDVVQAGIVWVGTHLLALSIAGFSALNIGLALVWLGIVWVLGAENRRRMAGASAEPGASAIG